MLLANKTPEQIWNALGELDLDCIKIKLMGADEDHNWSRTRADRVELQYKRFLMMSAITEATVVPSKEIDEFWHQHILDTRKYAEDCDSVFGMFFHHFPYFGMRGPEDAANLQRAFEETKQLYRDTFSEDYPAGSADCENCGNCPSSCGVGDANNTKNADHPDDFVKRNQRPTFAAIGGN